MARNEKQSISGPSVAVLEKAVTTNPADPKAWYELATALRAAGRYRDAIAAFEEVVQLNPGFFAASHGAAQIYQAFGRHEDAARIYARAASANPELAAAHILHGVALRAIGKLDDAEAALRRAIELDPGAAEAWHGLATVQGDRGLFADAVRSYRRALKIRPNFVEALTNLILISDFDTVPPELAELEAWAEGQAGDPQLRLQAHFALGKAYDTMGDHARAFTHFRQGNALKRDLVVFDRQAQRRFVEHVVNTFDRPLLKRLSTAADTSRIPVFIMGMPRSGTTLIEQVLASHPDVHGAGEVRYLANAVHAVLGAHDDWSLPDRIAGSDEAGLRAIGKQYLRALTTDAPEAKRVTDKMLGNSSLVGLIHALFPQAPLVFVRRDPIDTCLSCYSKHFQQGHEFSYDFDDLAAYFALYQQQMDHWTAVLPEGCVLNVRYEDFVGDLPGQTARLLEHCGLEWNDACLNFYATDRPVATASRAQVRTPIYTSSIGRWRRYEPYLEELLEGLRREGILAL